MHRVIIPLFSLFLVCCKQPPSTKPLLGYKDSVVNEYLAQIDSLEFYDTTNYDFKVMKAYFKNDTSFFRQMQKDIEFEKKNGNENSYFDSCALLKKLSDLNVDEAYRFQHIESFCFYGQFVTISRIGNSISLHYLEISFSPDGKTIIYQDKKGGKRIGPGCRIEKEFSRNLDKKDWQMFEEYLEDADYWGLKPHNPRLGFDGSSWTVEGYYKQPRYGTEQQIHKVYRWSPINSFAELGRLFMKLSGEKSMCGSF